MYKDSISSEKKSVHDTGVEDMEEEITPNPTPDNTDQELVKSLRDDLPGSYFVKIESFSRLVNSKIEKYESSTFRACGFNWRLVLYPNGNAKQGGEGHISLYFAIDKADTIPIGCEFCVTFKMLVLDHRKGKYMSIPDDSVHQIRGFHQAKKESGFDRLISLDTFNAATNGYLIDDSCVFGIEVYEVKYTVNGEALKMIEDPEEVTFDWKVSRHCKKQLYSEDFIGGKHKWCLSWYRDSKGNLSLYLKLVKSPWTVKKVLAEYSLVLKNWQKCRPKNLPRQYEEATSGYKWFSTAELSTDVSSRWGFTELPLPLLYLDIYKQAEFVSFEYFLDYPCL